MTDRDIQKLKDILTCRSVFWHPDSSTCRKIVRVGPPPAPEPGDEPEPSECAYLANGEYLALYNASESDFLVGESLANIDSDWTIEYEIPPLRAIYHKSYLDFSKQQAVDHFSVTNQGATIRKIKLGKHGS